MKKPSGKVEAVCPGCGQWDSVQDASYIAAEHAANTGIAAQGSRFTRVERKPDDQFRWHAI